VTERLFKLKVFPTRENPARVAAQAEIFDFVTERLFKLKVFPIRENPAISASVDMIYWEAL